MHGKTVCYHHGGKSRVGAAVNTYKHGRHSKYLPVRLAAQYQAAQHDPQLLSLRSEVALLDARLAELLSRVDSGESGELWTSLRKEWEEFLLVRTSGDVQGMHRAIGRLDGIMERAIRDHLAWQEIGEKIEQRRKLVDTEQKRLITSQQMINQTEAMVLVAKLTDTVTRAVLGIASHLPRDEPLTPALVDRASKQALSSIVVDLQQMLTYEGAVLYAEETVS